MKRILLLVFVFNMIVASGQNDSVSICGKVTDFDDRPVKNALVMLKGENFGGFVDTTYSDRHGFYSLKVKRGWYSGMAVIDMEDYGKSKLEFWAFEIPAFENLNIDARYDRLEIYGLNVFEIQGAYPGYTIYFRPMSLTRILSADMEVNIPEIAPPPDQLEIRVEINGEPVNVNHIQRVEEFAGEQKLYAFLIHTDPCKESAGKYDVFRISVTDRGNGDRGEAICFREKSRYE